MVKVLAVILIVSLVGFIGYWIFRYYQYETAKRKLQKEALNKVLDFVDDTHRELDPEKKKKVLLWICVLAGVFAGAIIFKLLTKRK
jgi:uncharacterized membrane-anchored protein YhcB (DUF1043 family)